MSRVGILALQGDVEPHAAMLRQLGATVRAVRVPDDLQGIDGIVIPGGESTTVCMLLESSGLKEPLGLSLKEGLPALGTCAGMILLATEVVDGRSDQWSYGAIDIAVRRNGYGRQIGSFETDLQVGGADMHAVFIRAPMVESTGPQVEVLASLVRSGPVLCRQGDVIVSAFHPEIAGDGRIHAMFLAMIEERQN